MFLEKLTSFLSTDLPIPPANFSEYSILSAAETFKGGARFILGVYFIFLYHFLNFLAFGLEFSMSK